MELVFRSIHTISVKKIISVYILLRSSKKINVFVRRNSKKEEFVRGFTRYQSNFLKVNELEDYLKLEVFSNCLFFMKNVTINIYYQIDENNYLKCKKKIYHLYEKDIKSRYYYHRNLVMVKNRKV